MVTEQAEDSPPNQIEETAILTDSISIAGIVRTMFFVGWDTSPTIEDAVKHLMKASGRQSSTLSARTALDD